MAVSYLNEIEKGKKFPKPDKILTLANALGANYVDLISPDFGAKLEALSHVLKSGALDKLPLEAFGFSPGSLFELMGNAPERINVVFDLCEKIGQRFDITIDHLLRAAVLSHLEQHKYYFADLEAAAAEFRRTHDLTGAPTLAALARLLRDRWQCTIDRNSLLKAAAIPRLRAAISTEGKSILYLNPNLHERDQAFELAREIGYRHLELTPRVTTSPPLEVDSFTELVGDARASYFAGAVLLEREPFAAELHAFFARPTWDGDALLQIMTRHRATPEMFFHRISQLSLPEFGVDPLYYVRMHRESASGEIRVAKEIHHEPMVGVYAVTPEEHYCRRWISIQTLLRFEQAQLSNPQQGPIVGVHRSHLTGHTHDMFILTLAYRHAIPQPGTSAVVLGYKPTDAFKRTFRFWNDPAITFRKEGQTCERCGFTDCAERVAPPTLLERENQLALQRAGLANLQKGVATPHPELAEQPTQA